jgi:hypothetical protein
MCDELCRDEPERVYLIEYRGRPVKKLRTAWVAAKRKAGITRNLTFDVFNRYLWCMILLSIDNQV